MLIQTPPKVNDVVSIKLVTGEEVIAKLKSELNDEYELDTPLVLQLVPMGNGQATVQFVPFMLSLEESPVITIHYNKMLMRPVKTRDDAAKQYLTSTSGIVV